MQVIEKNPDLLVLRFIPWSHWLFGLIWLVLWLGFGALIVDAAWNVTRLSCDRTRPAPGSCDLTFQGLFKTTAVQIPLNRLKGAQLEQSSGENGPQYRVIVVTHQNETYPLSNVLTSDKAAVQAVVNQIQLFVQNPQEPSLLIEEDSRGIGAVVGGLCLLSAVAGGAFLGRAVICKVDKMANQLTLTRFGLFWVWSFRYPLEEITGVQVRQGSTSSSFSRYWLHLTTTTGKEINLTPGHRFDSQVAEQTAKEFNRFLK